MIVVNLDFSNIISRPVRVQNCTQWLPLFSLVQEGQDTFSLYKFAPCFLAEEKQKALLYLLFLNLYLSLVQSYFIY